jgi:hypothetical protein
MNRCYGKLPARADARRLMFAAYSTSILPPPPATTDRTYGITEWGVMGNDRIGDCAYAAVGHHIMAWSMGTVKKPTVLSDDTIIGAYASGTGYNPANPATDRGSSMLDVQQQWRTQGIGGNKLVASAGLDLRDPVDVKSVVHYYGGAYCGFMLPRSAEEQTAANLVWTTPWFSPIVGGHAIPILSYDAAHLWAITWGKIQAMTWDFFFRYCDEAYALVDPLWAETNGTTPAGLRLDALVSDLGAVHTVNMAPPFAVAA